MNKAILLDRDGVIITERGDYNYLEKDITIVKGIAAALRELSKQGYMFIVITNQGGIARGLYSHERVNEIHEQVRLHFESEKVTITDFYYCPHHPSVSACLCRKPDSLMLEKAMARYDIDPVQSWFIGDAERDIEAGIKAGLKTLLIPSNADLGEYLEMID
jgi:D-glycero-D-manno-heptose 1,7-bisphosphate phosphatase